MESVRHAKTLQQIYDHRQTVEGSRANKTGKGLRVWFHSTRVYQIMGSKVLASLASVFSFGVFRCRILKNEKSTYLCQSPKIKNLKTLSWKILIENPLWLYWKLWICPLLQWLNNIWPCSSVSLCTKFEVSNFYHAKVREGGGLKILNDGHVSLIPF